MNLKDLRELNLRNMITNNLQVKIITGIIALMVWFGYASQQNTERAINVKIDFNGIPAHLALAVGTIDQVTVNFKGTSGIINNLTSENFPHYQLDVSGMSLGLNAEPLSPSDFNLVRGAVPVSVEPSRLEVILKAKLQRLIAVKAAPRGQLAEGYVLGEIRVQPEMVMVEGPEDEINRLSVVFAEEIDIEGVSVSKSTTCSLALHNDRLRLVDTSPVTITIEVVPEMVVHTFPSVPVVIRNLPAGVGPGTLMVRPEEVMVEVEGPRNVIAGMGPASVVVAVDASREDFMFSPQLEVQKPENVTVLRIEPQTVQIEER